MAPLAGSALLRPIPLCRAYGVLFMRVMESDLLPMSI